MALKAQGVRDDQEETRAVNIVLADGGLGNQLFHLAFALYLTETSGEEVMINAEMDSLRHRHGTAGLSDIATALNLRFHAGHCSKRLIQLALLRRSLGTRKLFSLLAGLHSFVGFGGARVYAGYWQNVEVLEPYYVRVADACRDVLSLRPSGEACLHIRIGDYNNSKNRRIYAQIGSKYYVALRYIQDQTEHRVIRVLTNDPENARKIFSARGFAGFDFHFKVGSALNDFSAIGASTALVASNSTFCWWGALIAARLGGLTHLAAPKHWLNPGYRHRQSPSYTALPKLSGRLFDQISF